MVYRASQQMIAAKKYHAFFMMPFRRTSHDGRERLKLPINMTCRPHPGQTVRRASRAITAVLAISVVAFSVMAQEPGGDRRREQRSDGHDRPQVWFAPNDDLPRPSAPGGFLNHDFPHLFDPNPAWDPKIDVFKISPKMGSTVGPADELTRISGFLKARHVALAVSVGTMLMDSPTPVSGECGFGVEGSNRPGRNAIEFRRLKQLDLEVSYVAMDEPLTFGHYYNKKNACRFSIDEVARRVASAIAEIRQYYPDVRVVDEEAPPITTAAQWNADFPKWLEAYRRATGQPLDAIMYDLDWRQPWQAVVTPSVRVARAAGVRPGIFITGAPPPASDSEAVGAYRRNIQAVEATGLRFDLINIANWTPHPARNLPQSDPDTMTSVLAWYLRQHGANGRDGSGR
jgi:hypothetical protein